MPRFSLTKKQLSTGQGASLLSLLMEITSDGHLTESEVTRVQDWIEENGTDLPAASYLTEVIETVLRDGRISLADRWDLLLAIEAVVPTEERVLVKMRRRDTPEPATPRQLEYLRILHVDHTDDMTKEQAAELIDAHKDRHSRKRKPEAIDATGCGQLIALGIFAFLAYWAFSYCTKR